jgi:hypothetical protein
MDDQANVSADTNVRDLADSDSKRTQGAAAVSITGSTAVVEIRSVMATTRVDTDQSSVSALALSLSAASGAFRQAAAQDLYAIDDTITVQARTQVSSPLGSGAPAMQQPGNEAAAHETDETTSPDGNLQDKPTWQKRMLHITTEGNDAYVWIRDAALDPSMSSALVARLVTDLAQMGLRMTGATINGKSALRESDHDEADRAAYPTLNEDTETDVPLPALYDKDQRHGA